jgi:hypothetical protein
VDDLAIFNMAIAACGGRTVLASTADQSAEAQQCRLWYVPSRNWVFQRAYWPTTRVVEKLTLLATNDFQDDWTPNDPPLPWKYAYQQPVEMVSPREITTATPTTTNTAHAPPRNEFALSTMNGTKIIATNVEFAVLSYNKAVDNPAEWDADLLMAVIYRLASDISAALSLDLNQKQALMTQSNFHISEALVRAANADNLRMTEPEAELVQARTGIARAPQNARR